MSTYRIFLFAILLSFLTNCNNSPKPKQVVQSPAAVEEEGKLNDALNKKIGSWAREGVECYGLVVLTNSKQVIQTGKSVKTVIVRINSDSLKVKVLEDVSLGQKKDCNLLGVTVGYTFWESDGDLFQTREEADNFLKSKGWEYKEKKTRKFKIGD
jgi:hypothetical protein